MLHNATRKRLLLATSDFHVYVVDEEDFKMNRQFIGFNEEIFGMNFFGTKRKNLLVASNSAELRFYDMDTWSCKLISGWFLCTLSEKKKTMFIKLHSCIMRWLQILTVIYCSYQKLLPSFPTVA